MTNLNIIIKRAMSLMKAHVEYSQNLAAEFSHLIKDYEVLIESTAEIVPAVQEEVDLEAVCTVFEELMENEPIDVLRTLRPYGVEENAEEAAIEPVAVEKLHENKESVRTKKLILCRSKKVHLTKNKQYSLTRKGFSHKSNLKRLARVMRSHLSVLFSVSVFLVINLISKDIS